jgi:hypothetical protein
MKKKVSTPSPRKAKKTSRLATISRNWRKSFPTPGNWNKNISHPLKHRIQPEGKDDKKKSSLLFTIKLI